MPLDLNAYNGALRLAQTTGSRIGRGFETPGNLQKQRERKIEKRLLSSLNKITIKLIDIGGYTSKNQKDLQD